MDKEGLKREIENMPTFSLRDIVVRENSYITGDTVYRDIENLKAIVRDDTKNVVSVVSNKYKLVQFKDVFLPAVENIEKIQNAYVLSYGGKGYVEIYPEGEEFVISNRERVGIALKNSVDKAWAIRINFVINSKDFPTIALPSEVVKGLRKIHAGKIEITEDFLKVVNEAKECWKKIVSDFQSYLLEKDELEEFAKKTKIGSKIRKKIEEIYEDHVPTLWEVFVKAIEEVSKRNFKSELNRKEKLERIAKAIFDYSIVLSI
jgi:hypothetical protein